MKKIEILQGFGHYLDLGNGKSGAFVEYFAGQKPEVDAALANQWIEKGLARAVDQVQPDQPTSAHAE